MRTKITKSRTLIAATLTLGLVLAAPATRAGTINTFTGQDDGAAIGSAYTNSLAAQTSFLAAASAFGAVDTHDFGNQTLGALSGTWLNGDGTWTTTQPNGCCTNGLSGISNITRGNLFGFNVSSANGSGKWLGFPSGTATFDFTVPTDSFGFFATGVQSAFGNVFTVSFNDGSSETLNVPINNNGGPEYFGVTDTSSFTSITISRPAPADGDFDDWGIDDLSFNVSTAATPLPAALPLFAGGLGALGLLGWRRKRKNAAAIAA